MTEYAIPLIFSAIIFGVLIAILIIVKCNYDDGEFDGANGGGGVFLKGRSKPVKFDDQNFNAGGKKFKGGGSYSSW